MTSERESISVTQTPILVIGMSAAGAKSLPSQLLKRINKADLLVGGRRHLAYFPHFEHDTLTIGANIQSVVDRLQQAITHNEQALVLASGDPLCYGIGATLRRYFPAEQLEIIPAASAFQLAFAALAQPWQNALLLSAHGRPLDTIINQLVYSETLVPKLSLETRVSESAAYPPNLNQQVIAAPTAAILTDKQHTPLVIAQALLEAGLWADTPCAICENLGSAEQRTVCTTLAKVNQEEYAPLNVFVVWGQERTIISPPRYIPSSGLPAPPSGLPAPPSGLPAPPPRLPAYPPGLPDDAFATSAGQITKREVRLLSLAELALQAQDVMWDIGAGSGAVSIEAGRACPTASIYAIERRSKMCAYIYENLRCFPTPNLKITAGTAPTDIINWPNPNAVFIGGSGGRLAQLIKLIKQKLRSQGRLVINLATLENLPLIRKLLPTANISQVQINRGVPILELTRFEALNPIFIITWRKD